MGGEGKRPGRPWSPPRGTCVEINQLVELVRSWLAASSISMSQLHTCLTPEHFVTGMVPELRRLRDLLAGEGLEWDLVEAVADVCFPDAASRFEERLAEARALWQRSQASPTPVGGAGELALARELLEAKDRTIAVYQEMQRARTAYEASERGRQQALQIATLLFAMLGQAQANVAELKRRVDALQTLPAPHPQTHMALDQRLDRAQQQQSALREQLTRAERERETAQRVADHAARRVQALEEELAELRSLMGQGEPVALEPYALQLADHELRPGSHDDAALDDVDRALQKARAALDEGHDAVQQAADDVGYPQSHPADPAATIIPGQTHAVPHHAAEPAKTEQSSSLFGTTPNNPQASGSTAPVAALPAGTLSFVGSATRRIARGLDLDEIVMGLCRASVPAFSDMILCYLREPLPVGDDRPTGPVVVRIRRTDYYPPNESQVLDLLPSPPVNSDDITETCHVQPGGALHETMRGVRPVLADSSAGAAALDELVGGTHVASSGKHVILAPLRGRRRVIGAAVFLRRNERPPFDKDDLLVAAQLATHSALSIDKALLYGREAYIADELQRTMLPEILPYGTGVQLASRYLPAADTARVGGDWYDVIPLPRARVGLIIGDVMGHSMTSSAVMGQLRSSLKMLAGQDLPPHDILHQMDDVARDLGSDHLATCLYAVYDPVAQRITAANAGHPPPILLYGGGRTEVLDLVAGPPLGVGSVDYEDTEFEVQKGLLLLYTNGLVESRLRDLDTGIAGVRNGLSRTAQAFEDAPDRLPPPDSVCDGVLDQLGPGDRDDDIALLAVRLDGIAEDDIVEFVLQSSVPVTVTPLRARAVVSDALDRWHLGSAEEKITQLVEHVVGHVAAHTDQPMTVRVFKDRILRCEVEHALPPPARLPGAQPNPRSGLHMLDKLAYRWGTQRLSSGKVIWFDVDTFGK